MGYEQGGWDLSDLLPDASQETVEERLGELEGAVARFEEARSELEGISSERFRDLVGDYETIVERLRGPAGSSVQLDAFRDGEVHSVVVTRQAYTR